MVWVRVTVLFRFAVVLVSALLAFAGGVSAEEKRVALVIGNSTYDAVRPLRNPRNDAEDVADKLRSLGFEVIDGIDLDRAAIATRVSAFGRAAAKADIALFYYAGHGLQARGHNYIVPRDARIEYEEEIELFLFPLDQVMRQMERGKGSHLIFLDACRNNPFEGRIVRSESDRSAVALQNGLSRMETGEGVFIAYATSPGAVASDGEGRNSPFTAALLRHIGDPGVALSEMMIRVRNEVVSASGGRQTPWDSSSLTETIQLAGRGDAAAPASPANSVPSTPIAPSSDEKSAYDAAIAVGTCGALQAFAYRYPNSLYAEFAREREKVLCASPPSANQQVASAARSTRNGPIDATGRHVTFRAIAGDDRAIGWVYFNNCGVPDSEVVRLRKAVNAYRFRNLRLIPGTIENLDPASNPECGSGTGVRAYFDSGQAASASRSEAALNELAALAGSLGADTRSFAPEESRGLGDKYRFDLWIAP